MKRLAALGAMRISYVLKGRAQKEVFERFDGIIAEDVTLQEIKESEGFAFSENIAEDRLIDDRVRRLVTFCDEAPSITSRGGAKAGGLVLRSLLELIMFRHLQPDAAELLELVSPGNGNGVTLLTAARAAGFVGGIDEAMLHMKDAEAGASFLFACEEVPDFYLRPYFADTYLLGYLSGSRDTDPAFEGFAVNRDPVEDCGPVWGMENELKLMVKRISSLDKKLPAAVIITGEHESGRYTAACSIASDLPVNLLSVDFSYIKNHASPKALLHRLSRCCVLEDRALCIRNITQQNETPFLLERLEQHYREYSIRPLFLLTQPEVKPAPLLKENYLAMNIPKSDEACLERWKGYLPKKYKKLAERLASKMQLNAGQIRRVTMAMETAELAEEKIDERLICRLCYEVLDDGRYANIKRVEPGFSLDDLRIDDHNMAVLRDIVDQVEMRHQVYEGWGLRKRYAYGRCVSVILAGPPGTGKTMTVHALAGQLGLELYKVDLSQIVDKYIGETEKRLEEVFTKAQKSNMILFFDEADAVMGKRSEVKEAKDKYANTEISYILQRIEEYDGIVLLATNNLNNIDKAFMRRIRYVVSYQMPDKAAREEIWRGAFGKKVPLADDIDYDFLADAFELSGGEIKNIVLNATFYGAAEGGKVAMRHIMKAVYRENTKTKRIAFDGDYGGYAYLLHD
ncbi:MAG: ATP-binding protein [Lachnospiraceae bacterium]|nr:ATP-binding protein [Lachnospiraceae bacterium]